MTRATVRIFDRFIFAWFINQVLTEAGIDSKIVTKHAIQIDPRQQEAARAALASVGTRQRFVNNWGKETRNSVSPDEGA